MERGATMGGRLAWAAIATAAVFALGPAPASAEERGALTLAIVGLRASPAHTAELEEARQALSAAARAGGAETLGLEAVRERRDRTLPPGHAERVADRRAEARQAFLDFRFADAAVALDQARTLLFGRLADLLEDPTYIEVTLDLARVWLDMGQPELAREALLEAIRVAPAFEPAAGDYPPTFLEAYADARRLAELADRAQPPEAGRLVLAGLTAGLTFVVGGTVAVDGDRTVVELTVVECATGEILRPEPVSLAAGEPWEEPLRLALAPLLRPEELSYEPVGTSLFVLTDPPGADVEVDGFDMDVTTPASVRVEPGEHQLRLSLEGYRTAELTVTAWALQARPVEVTLTRPGQVALVRAWWLWTLVGVAAAGLVTGLTIWAVDALTELPDLSVSVGARGSLLGTPLPR